MENPTLALIHQHASVRHYKPDPLLIHTIEIIVEAGQRASTSSNLQMYSVIAITDPTTRKILSKICGDQHHVAEAPVVLVWCANLARLDHACQLRGYSQETDFMENFLVAATDSVIAAQNAALAAESLGLGICYIGSLRNDPLAVIDMLSLPRLTFPITGMTVGWPLVGSKPKPRLPLKAILHWEKYDPTTEVDSLNEYDKAMIATGIYAGRQIPIPGKTDTLKDYGWMEHSARRVSKPVRTGLREALEKQGFALK
jgi:FMN reductase (NADPH)